MMLFNTIVVATAVSAASVTWRCSTQGDPWRLLPTGSRLHAPPSTDICTQVPGTDCWGNDLRRVLGLTNAAACCDENTCAAVAETPAGYAVAGASDGTTVSSSRERKSCRSVTRPSLD